MGCWRVFSYSLTMHNAKFLSTLIAQGISNSLTVLASLRPRSSKATAETPPLIPSTQVLRKLHFTLPIAPTQGWFGTLPPTRTSALRDDTTIRIKSGTVIPHTEPSVPVAASIATANTTPAPLPSYPYPGYSAGQPHRGTYPQQQYKPGQTYLSGAQQGQAPAAAQAGAAPYYPNQQYGQGQYQYSPYYYAQGQAANTGANSNGRGTPQPAATATTSYGGGYYNNYIPPQPAQRAVANTVTATTATGKPYQQGANGQAPPTLPAHLKNPA